MEWRCEWCGKPHEEDDPPCDNCGHGSFERAVVRRTDLAEGGDPDTMTVWVCTACGREHPKNSPPCSRCNNATLEREEKRVDESNLTERPGSAGSGTVSAEKTTVWVCASCGREHPKHAPPCSRCGHATLERETRRVDEAELTVPGYRDLLTPRYLVALVAVLALVALFGLGATGTVDVPGFPDDSVPTVENVPGNATTAEGVSLAEVETAYVGALNDRREDGRKPSLDRRGRLDEVARYYNQKRVKAEAAGESPPSASELDLEGLFPGDCSEAALAHRTQQFDGTAADTAGTRFTETLGPRSLAVLEQYVLTGVDVHAAGGTLFLTEVFCTT
jgi:rRNA maturation endonuclease Nob1